MNIRLTLPRGLCTGLLFLPLVGGCRGLEPCFEGELKIEVGELVAGQSNCSFEGWSPGTELVIESTGSQDNLEDICRVQGARYIERPDDSLGSPLEQADYENLGGYQFAYIRLFGFDEEGCALSVNSVLAFNTKYADIDAAWAGQERGDHQAFFLRHAYSGKSEDCSQLFRTPPKSDGSVACSNVHFVDIAKR